MTSPTRARLLLIGLVCAGVAAPPAAIAAAPSAAPSDPGSLPDTGELRTWIVGFEQSPRGPFEGIRWFCADGAVVPPKEGCRERGGGIQHGALGERALALRAGGYAVANVLAELDPGQFTGPDADLGTLRQILIERFLIGWDDGWIFRGARSYRGAFQIEDEEAGARALILAMLADPDWRDPARFFLLRETVRLMPLLSDSASAAEVRQRALRLADRDPGFMAIRAKIHNVPDAGDAARVREYASEHAPPELAVELEDLAVSIDELYAPSATGEAASELSPQLDQPNLVRALTELGAMLQVETDPHRRQAATARLLGLIRKHFSKIDDPEVALDVMELSLSLERDAFATGNMLLLDFDGVTRQARLDYLDQSAEALYGAGFISIRQLAGVKGSLGRIERRPNRSVNAYRGELRYLARAPEWSDRWIGFHFGRTVAHLARLEPEVHLYPQDRLRGSPLLFYGAVVDGLVLDANRLAGIEHELFGERVGAGLRALNPGLARGVLASAPVHESDKLRADGIYLLPETTAELSPVAGILTRGEGSSLSHVQLLARNLGIPNVVVGEALLPRVVARDGTRAVLAVSPNGVVRLSEDGPFWDEVFGHEETGGAIIRPDLDKLDVLSVDLIPLGALRASDSGRTSGPKGANLGELEHFFGDAVPDGLVIPFGAFRRLLDRPLEPGGPAVFEWMKESYAAIDAAPNDTEKRRMASAFLARLRAWIESQEPGPELTEPLAAMLQEKFGPDGTYGVFLRSDTNVEDLPGFTGAGLNLTVPNVVGFENVIEAIRRVWASPFTERSWEWRQSHMEDPEYVFPAVVVQLGFPAEKSGVMVTADVEGGAPGWLSVAVSEGVGGAVDGQATESLLVNADNGWVRFLAQATAPERSELSPEGGIVRVPASGTDTVLTEDEISQLIRLAKDVQARFTSLRDEEGRPMPADIEFAFRGGRLALLQIRPFVESRAAQTSAFLTGLDAGFRERGQAPVILDAVPERPKPTPPPPGPPSTGDAQ